MKLKKKRLIQLISILGILIVILLVFLFMNRSAIVFTSDRNIEINSIVDYTSFIKKVRGGSIEDVTIDSSNVDTTKIGEYEVVYKYQDETDTLKVKVVDSTPPEVEVQEAMVALNQTTEPDQFIASVHDASDTEIAFSKNYKFDTLGEQEIEIVVSDAYDNETKVTAIANVVEDTTAPVITVCNMTFVVGEEVDLSSYASISDDLDLDPVLSVDQGNLDLNTAGSYDVVFQGEDASGNQASQTISVSVVEPTSEDEKVVYLTFDDGPSKYTQQVLDILDEYNCKATFFITGMNKDYRDYITIAKNKGHTIGLHTYSHNYSKVYASTDAYFEDLEKIGQLAKEYIGYVPHYIRFPGGSSNLVSKKYTEGIMSELTQMVEEKGYVYYDWNAENGDGYSHISKAEMYKRATTSSATQIMILMHDANGKENTVELLPKIIEYYQERGYTFKAIDSSSFVPHQNVNN